MLGKVLDFLGGGIVGGIDKIVGRFTGDKTAREAGYHDESMESRKQFAAEFQVANRTWFDSLIDGFNRIPRPVIVAMVIYYFWLSYHDPVEFQIMNVALDGVPEFMWQIALAIIGFYFVAREINKSRDKKLALTKKEFDERIRQIGELKAMKPALREPEFNAEMADESKPLSNAAIEEWNRRKGQK